MLLKIAGKEDLSSVISLVKELFLSSVYSKLSQFDEEEVYRVGEIIISGEKEDAVILLLIDERAGPVGVLVASKIYQMFNRKEKTGAELAFWLKDEYRERKNYRLLISAYKFWCKKVGCTSYLIGKMKNSDKPEEYNLRRIK